MELSLTEIAQLTNSELRGQSDCKITGVADLKSATSADASFFANPEFTSARYDEDMRQTKASAVFISEKDAALFSGPIFLITDNPRLAFQKLLGTFHARTFSAFTGIHPTAVIHETAKLGKDVNVGPYAVIDKNATIGDGTSIGTSVYVGVDTTIGSSCMIHPQVTIREYITIGNNVIIQPGAVIGSCGYGYSTDDNGQHTKLDQLGTVIIHDDVEIGSNVTVDRARLSKTEIGKGTKVDNLVQVGHGAIIGEDNLIVAQVGIAGSAKTGNRVIVGGQAGINGHIDIADDVMLAARSGVTRSLRKPGKYGGFPAIKLKEHFRQQVHIHNIDDLVKEFKKLKSHFKPEKEEVEN